MDEEYWSIEPIIDRIKNHYGDDSYVYCADGTEGIETFEKGTFACIILDIMFPLGADYEDDADADLAINGGLIILKKLREEIRTTVPVICLSLRDDDEVKAEIEKYDHTMHISKLNSRAMETLISQLNKHLS